MMQTQAVKQESFVKTSWLVELLHQSVHLCEKLCPSEKIGTGTGGLRMCFDVENVIFFSFFLLWKSAIHDVTKVADATPECVFAHGSLWSGGSKVYVN